MTIFRGRLFEQGRLLRLMWYLRKILSTTRSSVRNHSSKIKKNLLYVKEVFHGDTLHDVRVGIKFGYVYTIIHIACQYILHVTDLCNERYVLGFLDGDTCCIMCHAQVPPCKSVFRR